MGDPTPADRRSPMEHERDARKCPLGDGCDLTVGWMAGSKYRSDAIAKARIEGARAALNAAARELGKFSEPGVSLEYSLTDEIAAILALNPADIVNGCEDE